MKGRVKLVPVFPQSNPIPNSKVWTKSYGLRTVKDINLRGSGEADRGKLFISFEDTSEKIHYVDYRELFYVVLEYQVEPFINVSESGTISDNPNAYTTISLCSENWAEAVRLHREDPDFLINFKIYQGYAIETSNDSLNIPSNYGPKAEFIAESQSYTAEDMCSFGEYLQWYYKEVDKPWKTRAELLREWERHEKRQ